MGVFPKIQSPCPYKGAVSEIIDGGFCSACEREVVDLDALQSQDRVALLAGCKTEMCVSYKFPLRPAIAAAMTVVALGAPMAAAAQELDVEEEVIIVGGITDPSNVVFVEDPRDKTTPEIAVVYDDAEQEAADDSRTSADLSQTVEHE